MRARLAIATVAAIALALAFPKAGAAWLAPLGAAALFWTWYGASWKRCFGLGWFAGLIFFTISFWWWSTTIKSEVGPLAYVAVVAGAALEALAFGVAGALSAIVTARSGSGVAPLGIAAGFAATEWLRSIGVLGAPFAQLGYTQADTPLKIFAAYAGANGVTFVLCAVAAYAAFAVRRAAWRPLVACLAATALALFVAWLAWPARTLSDPSIPVAAIQGNIAQSLKWQPQALDEAVARYTMLTRRTFPQHPRLIVWPETVITTFGLNRSPALEQRFSQLAAQGGNATIVAGSVEVRPNGTYANALFMFSGSGIQATYEKRQLVPFAETFPGKSFLFWLPYIGSLNGNFTNGTADGVYPTNAGLSIAPLICWESAFADLAQRQVRNGAQLLVISTDDAWFGTSSGPYQHAQIAQLRAIEAGEYVVRAAATGISGIIAPDGTWRAQAGLEREAAVTSFVGPPSGSIFARIGPAPVFLFFVAIYVALLVVPSRRET